MSNSGVLDTRYRSALERMAVQGRLNAYTAPIDPHICSRGSCGNDLPVRSLISALNRFISSEMCQGMAPRNAVRVADVGRRPGLLACGP